jgi:hypothetical protein
MFGITRKSLAVFMSALTMTLVLILVLATTASAGSPIVHRVHVGGPDCCADPDLGLKPGCDKNFSLVAIERADGSVSGQFTDRWGEGLGGFHAVIDCLSVDGNEAWVSGVIIQGTWGDIDLTGWPVVARVRDNGTSANDPPDQISGVQPGPACTDRPPLELYDVPQGQVKVK